jgi:transcriptional regulator with XRE-family HTH domain
LNLVQNQASKRILIGSRFKIKREYLGMTQQILAGHLDVDVRTVKRIEKGEQNFSINLLFKIMETLEVSAEELLS